MVFNEWKLLTLYRHKEILVNSSLKATKKKKKKKIGYNNIKNSGERSSVILALLFFLPIEDKKDRYYQWEKIKFNKSVYF